jgi:hypothetical protein
LLDPRAGAVERSGEVLLGRPGGPLQRDDRCDAPRSREIAVDLAIVALVTDDGARRDVGAEVEEDVKVARVTRLSAGEVEGDRMSVQIGFQVDFA